MNVHALEWLGEYQAGAPLSEVDASTKDPGLVGEYLAKMAMVTQLLAYRLGVKSK